MLMLMVTMEMMLLWNATVVIDNTSGKVLKLLLVGIVLTAVESCGFEEAVHGCLM